MNRRPNRGQAQCGSIGMQSVFKPAPFKEVFGALFA